MRPFAAFTASTQTVSSGFAVICCCWTASVGATYDRVVSVASRLSLPVRQVTIFAEVA